MRPTVDYLAPRLCKVILQFLIQVSAYYRSEGHVAAVDPGQSKVSQLHLTLTGHQNILWFQVSVHHTVRVKE